MSSSMASTLLRSASRPNPIFPNLRRLSWSIGTPSKSSDSVHILFLHSGVRRLTLFNIHPARINWELYPLRSLFQDIARLAPHVSQLEIRPFPLARLDGLEEHIIGLFSRLPSITRLAIDPTLLTASVLQSLSKHSHLEEIVPTFDGATWSGRDLQSAADFLGPITLKQGAFSALKVLHLSMSVQCAIAFLVDENAPSAQLKELRVRVLDCVNNADVQGMLAVIAKTCSRLRVLVLILYPPKFTVDGGPDTSRLESLNSNTIEPVRQAKTLEFLAIFHTLAVSISEVELLQLVDSLPSLASLWLVPRPDWEAGTARRPSPSAFSWHTLAVLLQKFPRLRQLGLYFDLSLPSTKPGNGPAVSTSPGATTDASGLPSSTLQTLSVGTTAIPSSLSTSVIAFKLTTLLGGPVELRWGLEGQGTKWGVPLPVYMEPSLEPELKGWEEVTKLFYFGLSARSGVYHPRLPSGSN